MEGARILTICNACRYCEGFCAVFPAIERRTNFAAADLNYLANLCHNCGECYYACQYAPPHEFAVNVPKTLAEIRVRSYRQYAWPRPMGNWLTVPVLIAGLAVGIFGARTNVAPANFYAAIPHGIMVAIFGTVGVFVLTALIAGLLRFWRESEVSLPVTVAALQRALSNALTLRYLSGTPRSWFHHLTSYGFLLCFASTTVAAFYHYAFRWRAPYGYLSLPVVLGTLGGIGLIAGPAGLFWLKQRQDAATRDPGHDRMDRAFLTLLFFTGATGLLLLALRETRAMPLLLAVHLAVVLALFVSLPYGKFVHGIYRLAALLRYALERPGAN
ncbi:MAG: tricarballylate utilization 4Fe-4S protein TcuB [Acidobacteriia bacterium]|nr:tricarballylate utilization 4Fe-4S protein TcuB [Terriglobia bacterium]